MYFLRTKFVSMNQVRYIFYGRPCTKNCEGVTYFHPLPSTSIISSNLAAKFLTPLGLALLALKTAHDMVPEVYAYKERCVSLVDRCAQLMINACSQIGVDSPIQPTSDLRLLEKYRVNISMLLRDIRLILVTQHLHHCSRYHNEASECRSCRRLVQ